LEEKKRQNVRKSRSKRSAIEDELIFPYDVFRLYALDFKIENEPPLTAGKVLSLMEGHVIAKAAYMGTYR
jgi:phosphatidylethanolamine-binding protein (PEBP) family uncharacterized protein